MAFITAVALFVRRALANQRADHKRYEEVRLEDEEGFEMKELGDPEDPDFPGQPQVRLRKRWTLEPVVTAFSMLQVADVFLPQAY